MPVTCLLSGPTDRPLWRRSQPADRDPPPSPALNSVAPDSRLSISWANWRVGVWEKYQYQPRRLALFLDHPQIGADPATASVGLWMGHKISLCVNLGPSNWPVPRLACLPASGRRGRQRRHRPGFLWSLQALAPQADNGELALSV